MEIFLSLLIPFALLTYFLIYLRERILCRRKFESIIEELIPRIVEIRYLHPTDSEQNIANEYYGKLYITENGLILIPEMPYIFSPDIFLFVKAKIYADAFPKPTFLCEINDFRTSQNMTVLTSKVKYFFNTNSTFEMIFESPNDQYLIDDLKGFLEKADL